MAFFRGFRYALMNTYWTRANGGGAAPSTSYVATYISSGQY